MREIHALGKAPVIRDGDTVLAESGAIVDYIVHRYAGDRLAVAPAARNTRATSIGFISPKEA